MKIKVWEPPKIRTTIWDSKYEDPVELVLHTPDYIPPPDYVPPPVYGPIDFPTTPTTPTTPTDHTTEMTKEDKKFFESLK